MNRSATLSSIAVSLILTCFVLTEPVASQHYWLHAYGEREISLEVLKPRLYGYYDYSLLNSTWFLSGNFSVTEAAAFVVEFPFANYDIDNESSYYKDESIIGNPYVGFRISTPGKKVSDTVVANFGLRLPLAQDDKYGASYIGMYTSFDRFEAFVPDLFTILASGGCRRSFEGGASISFAGGGTFMVPTEDGNDPEMFIDYNLELWYRSDKAGFGSGFTGRLLITEGDLNFGERTVHQMGFSGYVDFGTFRPGLNLRFPLDDDPTPSLDYVYGFSVTFDIE
jgi:hypothetical protein